MKTINFSFLLIKYQITNFKVIKYMIPKCIELEYTISKCLQVRFLDDLKCPEVIPLAKVL